MKALLKMENGAIRLTLSDLCELADMTIKGGDKLVCYVPAPMDREEFEIEFGHYQIILPFVPSAAQLQEGIFDPQHAGLLVKFAKVNGGDK